MRFLPLFLILGSAFFLYRAIRPVASATISTSNISVTPGSTTLSATTTYTIQFTPVADVSAPGGFVSLNINSTSGPADEGFLVNLSSATLSSSSTLSGAINRDGITNNASTGILLSSALTGGTSYTIVLENAVNPSKAGVYQLMITTLENGSQVDQGTSDNIYLGMGAVTKTISGQVTYSSTGAGVSTAMVMAMQKGGDTNLNTNTDSNGNYSLSVPGGIWEIMIMPQVDQNGQQVSVDWAYQSSGPPPSATFAQDATAESATLDFTVVTATATVKGKLAYPGGSPVTDGAVDVRNQKGQGVSGSLGQDGSFSVSTPAGTYNISGFISNPDYAVPSLPSFSIGDNETKDFDTITLVRKNEFIRGTIKDKDSSAGIANVPVIAWSPSGGGFASTTSGTDGTYSLALSTGRWQFMPQPNPSSGYTYEQSGPPEEVDLGPGQTTTGKDFYLTRADATIIGTVVDAATNSQVGSLFAFAMAMRSTDPPMPGPGDEVVGGAFTLAVPHGTYSVNVHMGPDSDYSSAGAVSVAIGAGETKSVQIKVKQNNATIQGLVKDSSGNAILGASLEVGAHSSSGSFKSARVDPSTGRYQMGVVSGESWYLGVFVDSSSGYMSIPPDNNKVTPSAGQTLTQDFTLLKANATLKVNVKDPNGNTLSNVFVFANSNVVGGQTFAGPGLHTGDLVGGNGSIELKVAAGTWGVGSGAPSSLSYINPELQEVSIGDSQYKEITLQYKQADAQITGNIYLDGSQNKGFVWAWSEKGGYSETMSLGGSYTLNVTSSDTWHIGADFEQSSTYYRSAEKIVSLPSGTTSAAQDLYLEAAPWAFPASLSQTVSATQTSVLTLSNGMTITIPANSIATSGNITITVTPTGQLAKQRANRPVGFGYEIKAINSSGQEITSTFTSNVTITIPYTEAMLSDLGITEDQLSAAYFDSTSSLWQGITSIVVDKDNNQVVLTIAHFTPFSLVTGSADTTPPANPTNFTARAVAGGQASLSWTQPSDSDFDKIYIYRSTTAGETGTNITTVSKGATTYTDTGLSGGTNYYYILKAADTTGNLSTGTSQVKITALGASATPTPTPVGLPATGSSTGQALAFYLQKLLGLLVLGSSLVLLTKNKVLPL